VNTVIYHYSLAQVVFGIAIDDDEAVYVTARQSVYKIGPRSDPSLTLIADLSNDGQDSGGGLAIFYYNKALYVPRSGQLTKINLAQNNMVTRFAGSGNRNFTQNGFNSSASFDGAFNCVADLVGNIYVSEYVGSVRKVLQDGEVQTLDTLIGNPANNLALKDSNTLVICRNGVGFSSINLTTNEITNLNSGYPILLTVWHLTS
jgi:hypothetical protein